MCYRDVGMSVIGDDTSQNDSVSQVTVRKPIGDATPCRPTHNSIAVVTADKGHLTQLSSSDLNTDSLPSRGRSHLVRSFGSYLTDWYFIIIGRFIFYESSVSLQIWVKVMSVF